MDTDTMFALRWENPFPDSKGEAAMLGDVWIGSIGEMTDIPGTWYYKVDGIDVKWMAKRNGQVKGKANARDAVERAWLAWLKAAGLAPLDTPTPDKTST